MNLDRFGFKAMDMRFSNVWIIATLKSRNGEAFDVEWNYKGKEKSFSTAWIKPETICQCTGLKDSDGKLIYENDILEVETLDGNQIGHVYYQELIPSFRVWLPMYTTTIPALMSLAEMNGKKVRVIGNKFDSLVENG